MSIKAVLFDLDGSLLPMDMETFVNAYFGTLVQKMAQYGYEPQRLIRTIRIGLDAMVKNDGSILNEDLFWNILIEEYGEKLKEDWPIFEAYYHNEFQTVQGACGFDPEAAKTVYALKDMGYRVILATNPLFPPLATQSRIRWAGLEPEDFELVTTYENSSFCKPNLDYYRDILARQALEPSECIMVGNDVSEDMIAEQLGIKTYLLTRDLINPHNEDINRYPHGDLPGFLAYLSTL